MKKNSIFRSSAAFVATALFMLGATSVQADVLLANETFTGNVLPAGWSNVVLPGGSAGEVWFGPSAAVFTITAPGFDAGFAFIDSDGYGSASPSGQLAALGTPSFSAAGFTNVTVHYTHRWRRFSAGDGVVEYSVDGGTVWNPVATYTANTPAGSESGAAPFAVSLAETVSFPLPLATDEADVRVRFRFTGDFEYYWLLDNVRVEGDAITGSLVAFTNTTGQSSTSAGTMNVDTSVTPGPATSAVIDYTFTNGTAVAGTDFNGAGGTLTISNPATTGQVSIPLLAQSARSGNKTFTMNTVQGAGSDPLSVPASTVLTIANGVPLTSGVASRVYGADFFGGPSNEFYDFDPETPLTGPTVLNAANGLNPGTLWGYGDFQNEAFGTFFFTRGLELLSSNTLNFAETSVATITGGPAGADFIRGMKYDRTTSTWYLAWNVGALTGAATLGTINIATGVVTPIGSVGSPLNGMIINPNTGEIFGFDVNNATDRLISINKATGAGTVVGPLGTNLANFTGDGDYDDSTGIAYYSGTDNGGTGFNKWFSVNTTTGALTEIANLESALGLGQMSALGITGVLGASVNDWDMH